MADVIKCTSYCHSLVSYVKERPWWPIQSPTKEEESERVRGERDRIKFIDLRFERWQVVRFRKARRRQDTRTSNIPHHILSSIHYLFYAVHILYITHNVSRHTSHIALFLNHIYIRILTYCTVTYYTSCTICFTHSPSHITHDILYYK